MGIYLIWHQEKSRWTKVYTRFRHYSWCKTFVPERGKTLLNILNDPIHNFSVLFTSGRNKNIYRGTRPKLNWPQRPSFIMWGYIPHIITDKKSILKTENFYPKLEVRRRKVWDDPKTVVSAKRLRYPKIISVYDYKNLNCQEITGPKNT